MNKYSNLEIFTPTDTDFNFNNINEEVKPIITVQTLDKTYDDMLKRMKKYREFQNITQEDMAKKCGLSKNHISAMERGVNKMSAQTLIAYAKTLNIPLSKLVGDLDNNIEELEYVNKYKQLKDYDKIIINNLIDSMLNLTTPTSDILNQKDEEINKLTNQIEQLQNKLSIFEDAFNKYKSE